MLHCALGTRRGPCWRAQLSFRSCLPRAPDRRGARPPAAACDPERCPLGPNQVRLAWSDPSSEELGFRIEYRDARATGFVRFAQRATVPADTTTWVGEVPAEAEYEYRVVTLGPSGDSTPSPVASARTIALPAPSELRALAAAPGWVELVWRDNASTETGYP